MQLSNLDAAWVAFSKAEEQLHIAHHTKLGGFIWCTAMQEAMKLQQEGTLHLLKHLTEVSHAR